MATTTTNLGLTKPAGSDKIRIAQINGNMDIIDEKVGAVGNTSLQTQMTKAQTNLSGAERSIAFVADGNKTTAAVSVGQYVLLKNSTIAGCSDGLYTAAQAISANTAIDSTYLTAVSGGGLNALNTQVATYNFGTNTIANHQTAMVTYGSALPDYTTRNIVVNVSATSGIFNATTYIGTFSRINSTRFIVYLNQTMNRAVPIVGRYKDGTWDWQPLVFNSYIENLQAGASVTIARKSGFIICSRVHSTTSLNVLAVFVVGMGIVGKIFDGGASTNKVSVTLSGEVITVTNNHNIAINIEFIA